MEIVGDGGRRSTYVVSFVSSDQAKSMSVMRRGETKSTTIPKSNSNYTWVVMVPAISTFLSTRMLRPLCGKIIETQ